MKENSLESVKKIISQEGFFEAVLSSVNDWDRALDERDDAKFDQAWSNSFEEVKALKYPSAGDALAVTEIREFVFKKVFSLMQNSEISGYISDDIGLVADSISKSANIKWVDKLFESYRSGCFPK